MGGEDPLEKEMATRSSILACEISWAEDSSHFVNFLYCLYFLYCLKSWVLRFFLSPLTLSGFFQFPIELLSSHALYILIFNETCFSTEFHGTYMDK